MSPRTKTNVLDWGATGDGASDDWSAVQTALDKLPDGQTLYFPAGRYRISRPLDIHGSRGLKGDGAFSRFGSVSLHFDSINAPILRPMLTGSVIVQAGSGQDALRLHATGETQHLNGLGLEFEGPHCWRDTGHGILAEPGPFQGRYDNGLSGATWSNVTVAGHDGDHYAARIINGIQNDFRSLHGFGGGTLHLINDSAVNGHYGNSAFSSLYGQVFVAGSADCIRLESRTPFLNLLAFVRPQAMVVKLTEEFFPEVTPPGGSQQMLRSVGDVRNVSMVQYDFETNVHAGVTPPDPLGGQEDGRFSSGVVAPSTWCWMDPAGFCYAVPDHSVRS
jgi:hypothetical protein